MQVVDLDEGKLVGDIPKISSKNNHGVALALEQNLGFLTAGADDVVVAFDLTTLKITKKIKAGKGPDAIMYDPASKHILAMNHGSGDITVIDPADLNKETVTIPIGGKRLEYGVGDGAGHVFVNLEDLHEVVKVDSKANRVLARWPLAPAEGPTGLAIDLKNGRLFAGCTSKHMVVLDAETGKILGMPPIGANVDGVAWEPTLEVAISSNGDDGTLTVVKETSPGKFEAIQTITIQPTKKLRGNGTIAVDTKTHQAIVPGNVPDGKGGHTFGIFLIGAKK